MASSSAGEPGRTRTWADSGAGSLSGAGSVSGWPGCHGKRESG
jgi:hypothetical protein